VNSAHNLNFCHFYFRCAQAVEQNDFSHTNELIADLRQYSSAYGNAPQRVAHYFMEALVSLLTSPHQFVVLFSRVCNLQYDSWNKIHFKEETMHRLMLLQMFHIVPFSNKKRKKILVWVSLMVSFGLSLLKHCC
jgi:hypothetical protein